MIEFICGRAHRLWQPLLSHIRDAYERDEQVLVLVPEQFTLQAERDLLRDLRAKGFFRLEVLSPSHLQYRVFDRCGQDERVPIDERGRTIAVARALKASDAKLHYYHDAYGRPGFVQRMAGLLSSLRSADLNAEAVMQASARSQQLAVRYKLQDAAEVLGAYEKVLAGQFADDEEIQRDMIVRMLQNNLFQGHHVFVYGFDAITESLAATLLALGQQAARVVITIVSQPAQAADGDAFAAPRQSVQRMMERANRMGLRTSFSWLPPEPLQAATEIQHLEQHFLGLRHPALHQPVEAVRLYAAPTLYHEMQHVAAQLYEELRRGVKAEDMMILCGSLDAYGALARSSLRDWGIPFHVADKMLLASHGMARFVLASLRCAAFTWRDDDVQELLKSGYCALSEQETWIVERYATAYGIHTKRWLEPFQRGKEEDIAAAEPLRQRLVAPVEALHRALVDAQDTAESVQALLAFLKESNVEQTAERIETQLRQAGLIKEALQHRQVLEKLLDILSQMAALMRDERIPLRHFADWLEAGLQAEQIASIPPESASVQVGQLGNLLPDAPRVVFVVGLNDGVLSYTDQSLLSQEESEEAERLTDSSLGLGVHDREGLALLALWKALSAPSYRLYLSYPLANEEGGALQPLPQLQTICRMFPLLVEEGGALAARTTEREPPASARAALDELAPRLREGIIRHRWGDLLTWLQGQNQWSRWLDRLHSALRGPVPPVCLPQALTQQLFDWRVTSVTSLERFADCPYRHYVEKGLRPRSKEEWVVLPQKAGTFQHMALEAFTRLAAKDPAWPHVGLDRCNEIMDAALRPAFDTLKNTPLDDSPRGLKMANAMADVARQMARTFTLTMQNSAFRPLHAELRFGAEGPLPPVYLQAADGSPIALGGIIDRVDSVVHAGKQHLRLFDYKSRDTGIDPARLWDGTQLQLMIYLGAVLNAFPQAEPAGVFYQRISNPIITTEDPDRLQEELFREMRPRGLFIDKPEIVQMMDMKEPWTLGKVFTNKGEWMKTAPAVSAEDMRGLAAHAVRAGQEKANRIAQGEMQRLPTRDTAGNTPCKYCEYGATCRLDTQDSPRYRPIGSMKMDELLRRVHDENAP